MSGNLDELLKYVRNVVPKDSKKPWSKTKMMLVKHAEKRAMQRYKIKYTSKIRKDAERQIQKGNAECIHRVSLNRAVFRIFIEGKQCLVMYDNKRHTIVTFLLPHHRVFKNFCDKD